jgi:hypothetical protein
MRLSLTTRRRVLVWPLVLQRRKGSRILSSAPVAGRCTSTATACGDPGTGGANWGSLMANSLQGAGLLGRVSVRDEGLQPPAVGGVLFRVLQHARGTSTKPASKTLSVQPIY